MEMDPLKHTEGLAEYLGEPCRNFNIFHSILLIDPRDGQEKYVLANFAAGAIGSIIIIDPTVGQAEDILLPGDSGAWALLNYNHEKLLVGTCAEHGYLLSLDLKSRTWAEPLQVPGESYIWNLTLASDGNVYGGTYPGCRLLRYDPEKHELESVRRVSGNTSNLYSRHVRGEAPGYILIQGGFAEPFMRAYKLETGELFDFGIPDALFKEVTEQWIVLEKDNESYFFDARSLEPLDLKTQVQPQLASPFKMEGHPTLKALRTKSGEWIGVRGQEYFMKKDGDTSIQLQRIPVEPPPTTIHSLIADSEGTIWGSTALGQTIFKFNPGDGSYWNSEIVTDKGGEVYGMCFIGKRLFMSAYAGGDHIVYDTTQPWDQFNQVNPMTLRSVAPECIRPTGYTIEGPDGAIWTGWSAKYGTYGGGISRVDPDTLDVSFWYDPISEQQVAGLAADAQQLYFTTNGGASGLAYKNEPCHFGVMSPAGEIVFKHQFETGVKVAQVVVAGGQAVIQAGKQLRIFNPEQMSFTNHIDLADPISWMVQMDEDRVAIFTSQGLYSYSLSLNTLIYAGELPGWIQTACVTPDLTLYFANKTRLYRTDYFKPKGSD